MKKYAFTLMLALGLSIPFSSVTAAPSDFGQATASDRQAEQAAIARANAESRKPSNTAPAPRQPRRPSSGLR